MKVLMMITPEEHYMVASTHKALDHKREARPLLGILSVATYLKNRRPEVELKVVDCRAEGLTFSQAAQKVREFKPDLVGLTCLTFNYYDTLRMAEIVKEVRAAAKVCIGGWHVTLYPRETLVKKDVDYVVFGEGERTFVDLVDALAQRKDPVGVMGLGYKAGGKAVVNAARPAENEPQPRAAPTTGTPIAVHGELANRTELIVNSKRPVDKKLDDIDFPDFSLVDIGRYSHILNRGFDVTLPMESSRGCPYACTFCDIRRTQFRYRSPELIADEMERWVRKGIRSFFFVDDNITVNKPRAIRLFEEIVRRHMDVEFKVSSRVDRLDDEVMHWMKRAGVSRVSVGIESSKQKYLDLMQKEITVEQVEDCLARARKVGLPVFAFMMIGLPGQTKKEMLEEVDFLKKHKVEYASFSVMTVYPKTELLRMALASGDIKEDPWQSFAESPVANMQAPYVNGLYSPEELKRIQLEATRRFYFSPRILYRRMREINSFKALMQRARMALRILGVDAV
jgi:anaerobic magnesium-protoporphyrin IX monomethyl ester cyclase